MEMLSGKFQPQIFKTGDTMQSMLAERRSMARTPVIKSAKLVVGEGYSQGVYNCLILDESTGGVLVDLGAVFNVPDEVVLHMMGGATRRAKRRWAVGSKIGLEFIGGQLISVETTQEMAGIAKLIRVQGLPAGIAAMRAQRFFGQEELRQAAEDAEAAYYKLEAMLREE
jgi:hypothetical protein